MTRVVMIALAAMFVCQFAVAQDVPNVPGQSTPVTTKAVVQDPAPPSSPSDIPVANIQDAAGQSVVAPDAVITPGPAPGPQAAIVSPGSGNCVPQYQPQCCCYYSRPVFRRGFYRWRWR